MKNLEWTTLLKESFMTIWEGFKNFVPELIVAIVLLVVGWIIATILAKLVAQAVRAIKLDSMLHSAGLDVLMKKGGFKINSGYFFGELVKWFVFFVFLIPAFQVLELTAINTFIEAVVLAYIPQVISAVIILVVAALAASFLSKVVNGSAKAAGISTANFLGTMTRWVIWILGILAALFQLGIAASFIQTAYTGVVIAIAIALGLSFGLGGQDAARDTIAKVRRDIAKHE